MTKRKNEGKYGIGSLIFGIIFLVWFFGTIAYMFYLSNQGGVSSVPKICIAFGQLFAGSGLILLVDGIKKRSKETPVVVLLIFVLVGIAVLAFGIITLWGSTSARKGMEQIIPHLMTLGFVVIGFSIFISSIRKRSRMNKVCTDSVEVKCVAVKSYIERDSDGHLSEVYSPIWEGYYRGKKQTFECNLSTSKRFYEGQEEVIMVNPKDPKEYIDSMQESTSIGLAILGFIFVIGGIGAECMILIGK